MMAQYLAIKKEHPGVILFFRMGDFYEMFGEDAVIAAKAMNIALTTRDKGSESPMPMCGVPHHALMSYLPRMINKGLSVAICEQVEDPKTAKGVVKREVVRIVTPGTVMEPGLLDEKSFNFLAAVAPGKRGFGLAAADLSTGLFRACEFIGDGAMQKLMDELERTAPKQILIPDNLEEENPPLYVRLAAVHGRVLDKREGWMFGYDTARAALLAQFQAASLDGFGMEGMALAICAAGAAAAYLKDTQKGALTQIHKVTAYHPEGGMALDPATIRNLEIVKSLADGGAAGSLFAVIDSTRTPMGARALKEWLLRPLNDPEPINRRLETVRAWVADAKLTEAVRKLLNGMGDLERISGRVTQKNCSPRDLLALRGSLAILPELRLALENISTPIGAAWLAQWDGMAPLCDLLARAVADDPPLMARDGGAIRKGFDPKLDALTALTSDSRSALLKLEAEERGKSGIANLRVKYNKIYGYFIEVSRKSAEQVPADWMRKQSLVNAERFVSPRLKELEEAILGAQERAMELELELFETVRLAAAQAAPRARAMAGVIGEVDTLSSLAAVAMERGYREPVVDGGEVIEIKGGRHPVLERAGLAERFVPNDTLIDMETARISIITGPNMAGKSTYIRQVAAICLLAQAGSYVPADSARIGVVDRIFTRVGAQDYLQRGQSTFMVEMNETALILNNATGRSLIILDEIGRGTSTFDGISIAWAVAERIHKIGARTLFATHYHELAELADSLPGTANLSVAVREYNGQIIFLRKIVDKPADKSYGVQVARLAGLPREVIDRAGEILTQLEANEVDSTGHPKLRAKGSAIPPARQTDMFSAPRVSQVEEELKRLDVNQMTPLDALRKLEEWKGKL
jgi:DNA mismatch repair protein MutS